MKCREYVGTLGTLLAVACLTLAGLPAYAQEQETVWFVVAQGPDAPSPSGGSFLLPLSNPANIADARRLIEEGPGFVSFTLARIANGGDGFNRNVMADGDPAWSWRVTEFVGFAEIVAQVCVAGPLTFELADLSDIGCTRFAIPGYIPVAELEEPPSFFISEG